MKLVTMRVALATVMMCGVVGAKGQNYYVFYNNTYGYISNNNGTLARTTTLGTNCIWIASDVLNANTPNTLQSFSNASNYLIDSNDGPAIGASDRRWGVDSSNRLYAIWGSNYYLKYNNYAFNTESTNANGNMFTAYEGTGESYPQGLSPISISGDEIISSVGTKQGYTHTNSTFAENAYTYITIRGTQIIVLSNGTTTNTRPATTTITSGYTWSLSDNASGYATVNASTGDITVTAMPSQKKVITLNCTVTYNGYSNTASLPITLSSSGVSSDGIVTLDDREDHNWSYYSDPSCPIRSLNPADVTITYEGNGKMYTSTTATPSGDLSNASGVKVGIDADAHAFVYYKTLERTDGATAASVSAATGRCLYTTIPNPFSVRPTFTSGGTKYYTGFYKWRVKSVSGGSIYTVAAGGTAAGVGTMLDAEQNIYFAPTNSTGMKVELEAVWARAYVATAGANGANQIGSYDVGYERNFLVLTTNNEYRFGGSDNRRISNTGYAATISRYYPDGTLGSTSGRITVGSTTSWGSTTYSFSLASNTKFEYVEFSNMDNRTITAAGYELIFGRGVAPYSGTYCANTIQGMAAGSSSAVNYKIRIESGVFRNFYLLTNVDTQTFSSTVSAKVIFGSDFDRAKSDNSKLSIASNGGGEVYGSSGSIFSSSSNKDNLTFDWTVKSGTIHDGILGSASGGDESIYIGSSESNSNNLRYVGKRRILIEGVNMASIAGGMNSSTANGGSNYNNTTHVTQSADDYVVIRIKGGTIRGSVYGAAAFAGAGGGRKFIFTGGSIGGWVAGGANGTQTTGGTLYGATRLYVGGNVFVSSNGSTKVINRAVGGNVFGAGCGYGPGSNSGQVLTYGTCVVVADNAYVERGVYGGGSYGYTTNTADIYILGGHVEGKNGGVSGESYSANITGGVYGGACQNQGGTTNITMTNGIVEGGLYGGSNATGTLSGNVTIQVNGGQVGADADHTANIHGGGYGNDTEVNGNILVNIGEKGQTAAGAMIYGDVYGGSALGNVNDAISDSVAIGLYRGTIQGNVYGGGLGNNTYAAAVRGNVRVDVDGIAFVTTYDGTNASDGSPIPATGRVFGCNNNNGTPNGSVRINVYKTARADGAAHTRGEYEVQAVYGGGNLAAYTPTTNQATSVNVYGCGESSIEYVYGGGNAAPVPATDVNVYGSYEINYVFGGGNGKDDVNGAANPGADVGKKKDGSSYGTQPVVGTANTEILGGVIHHVFGGSNTKGDVTKDAHVILGDQNLQFCEFKVDEVYGAGNEAYMSGDAEITMNCIEGLTAIYGGSRRADIGSPTERKNVVLNIYGGHFDQVFGGNNESGCIYGSITVNIQENGCLPIEIGELYLGGNQAPYSVYGYNTDKTPVTSGTALYGYPVLNVISATSIGSTYGGGLGATAKLYGNPHININMEQGSINGKYEYEEGKSDVRYKGKGYETAQTLDLGHLGTVYGGGNEAEVIGDTYIQVGTGTDAAGAALTRQDAQITGNVYGGGNHAEVTGKTNVVIGK